MRENRSDAVAAFLARHSGAFAERLSTNPYVLSAHGKGEAFHPVMGPDLVVFPRTTDEVQAVIMTCAELGLPITPFGAGTSLEGGVAAVQGGVTINLSLMNRVIEVMQDDLDCTVQAGVTREDLNIYLRDLGLFFPIDPGANATLGGMASTRASGTTAVRYGTMRQAVLWLTVVLADGRILRTGRRARKSSAGYDLTGLFVGSEGTLGIITEVGLRLQGIPEATAAAVCTFPTLADATNTVIEILQLGVPVARVELMDVAQVRACNAFSGTDLDEAPTLLFEFHGSEASVAEQAQTVSDVASANSGSGFNWAARPEDRNKLWKARHDAYNAAQALQPGSQLIVTDVCVPVSRLTDCIVETQKDLDDSGMVAPIVGHVGDGNFHVFLCVDPDDAAQIDCARALNDRLVARALRMDGTCTGEHGIGIGKQSKLLDELGPVAVDVMRALKLCLDPASLLNPQKIFQQKAALDHI